MVIAHIYLTFCLYTNADANINTLTAVYMHIDPSGGIVDCLEYLGKTFKLIKLIKILFYIYIFDGFALYVYA